jgi:hypothetical protein
MHLAAQGEMGATGIALDRNGPVDVSGNYTPIRFRNRPLSSTVEGVKVGISFTGSIYRLLGAQAAGLSPAFLFPLKAFQKKATGTKGGHRASAHVCVQSNVGGLAQQTEIICLCKPSSKSWREARIAHLDDTNNRSRDTLIADFDAIVRRPGDTHHASRSCFHNFTAHDMAPHTSANRKPCAWRSDEVPDGDIIECMFIVKIVLKGTRAAGKERASTSASSSSSASASTDPVNGFNPFRQTGAAEVQRVLHLDELPMEIQLMICPGEEDRTFFVGSSVFRTQTNKPSKAKKRVEDAMDDDADDNLPDAEGENTPWIPLGPGTSMKDCPFDKPRLAPPGDQVRPEKSAEQKVTDAILRCLGELGEFRGRVNVHEVRARIHAKVDGLLGEERDDMLDGLKLLGGALYDPPEPTAVVVVPAPSPMQGRESAAPSISYTPTTLAVMGAMDFDPAPTPVPTQGDEIFQQPLGAIAPQPRPKALDRGLHDREASSRKKPEKRKAPSPASPLDTDTIEVSQMRRNRDMPPPAPSSRPPKKQRTSSLSLELSQPSPGLGFVATSPVASPAPSQSQRSMLWGASPLSLSQPPPRPQSLSQLSMPWTPLIDMNTLGQDTALEMDEEKKGYIDDED